MPQLPPDLHEEIVNLIPGGRLLSVMMEEDEAIGVGLGVMDPPFFGLFDLVTRHDMRRQGYGSGLVHAMLAWAASHRGKQAYLQVVQANETARRLYEGIGFRKAFEYWYRVLEE